MNFPLFQVDAFTDRPFRGNPAAVCLLERERDAEWMQNVAAEMNLSETAFLLRADDGFGLRWFTPTVEVALCGHATLASAHALFRSSGSPGFRSVSAAVTRPGPSVRISRAEARAASVSSWRRVNRDMRPS